MRRGLLRWTAAGGLSALVHVLVVGTAGVRPWTARPLPRLVVQEVAGVPVPPEPEQDESARSAEPAREAPQGAPPEAPPAAAQTENEPRQDRQPGATLASRAPPSLDERAGDRPAADGPTEGAEATAVGADAAASDPPPPEPLRLPSGAEGGDLGALMAGEARVALLVRTELLAAAPEEASLRRTMREVPGFRDYFGQSGFDPLTDFEWMTLRTPDPTRVELSVVTARLAIDVERARAMIERVPGPEGARVAWTGGGADGGPELATAPGSADGGPSKSTSGEMAWAIVEPGPVLLAGPRRWVSHAAGEPEETLAGAQAGLEEVRLGDERPALVIAAEELRRLVLVPDGSTPVLPSSLVMAARFEEVDAVLLAHLYFERPAEAERFVEELQRSLAAWEAHPVARLLDLPDLWGRLVLQREGSRVVASARLGRSELRRVLALTRWFLASDREPVEAPSGVVDGAGGGP